MKWFGYKPPSLLLAHPKPPSAAPGTAQAQSGFPAPGGGMLAPTPLGSEALGFPWENGCPSEPSTGQQGCC